MEMINHNTRLFKNIFPDYQTFSEWYSETPLSDDSNDVPSKKTFTLIAYEYNDSHVAMSPDSFKEHFANELYTYYKEFEETTKIIKELMSLRENDLRIGDRLITNIADIPETESSTNVEEVDFISNQQKQFTEKSKLQVKREELSSKRAFTVKTFLKRFKHLFIKVLSPAYTYVVEENQGE